MASIAAGSTAMSPCRPIPAGTAANSRSASVALCGSTAEAGRPVSIVRTPQEMSKPTPPADTTPPSVGSNAATPPIGKP